MANVTFTTLPVVWISIRGERRPFPQIAEDGGLHQRLAEWLTREQIDPIIRSGSAGGGRSYQGYLPEDAAKVTAWLKEQGVTEQDWVEHEYGA